MNDFPIKPDRYSHPGKAGRPPKISTMVSRALLQVDRNLPAIFNSLIQLAIDGDREAQIYLIDRRLGKPKTTLDIPDADKLGTGMVVELMKVLIDQRRKLTEGDYDAKRLTEPQTSSHRETKEA